MRKLILVSLLLISVFSLLVSDTLRREKIVYSMPSGDIFFGDSIGNHDDYLKTIKEIELAPAGSVLTLHLAGYGGSVDTTVHLINAVERSKAEVVISVEGPVYSAHAFLSMIGDRREISDASLFMFHVPAVSVNGEFVSDIRILCKGDQGHLDRGQSAYDKCINQQKTYNVLFERMVVKYVFPVLTKNEIERYKAGEDVYIDGVEMKRRIQNGI